MAFSGTPDRTIGAQRLHHLLVFATIVREGSMTAAARSLGVSRSVVSGHLRNLEADLGVRLLERTTRRMALTQVGEEVHEAALRMALAAAEAGEAAEAERHEVRGELRIAFTLSLWPSLIRPALQRLRHAHPGLRIACTSGDERVDLVEERLDVAVRLGVPGISGNVRRLLAVDREIVVAAPDTPWRADDPADLAGARWIAHRHVQRATTEFQRGGERRAVRLGPPVASVDAARMLLDLVRDGAGLGIMPAHLVRADLAAGRLVRVLDGWHLRAVELYALMPSRRYNRRTAVFLEALDAVLAEGPAEG